jgi:hypothetical protein
MSNDNKIDRAQIQFRPLDENEFIVYASNIALIWVNRLFEFQGLQDIFKSSNTKARQFTINDITTWNKFSDSCFVPPVKPEEWSHGLYKLKEFLLSSYTRDDTRFSRLESEDILR